jgi:hypothetical protein
VTEVRPRRPFTTSQEKQSPFEDTPPHESARRIPVVNDDLDIFHSVEASDDFTKARRFSTRPTESDATALTAQDGIANFSPIPNRRTRASADHTHLSIAARVFPDDDLYEFLQVEREKAAEK